MSNKPNYKTSRKYKCPYCDIKAPRSELVDHVDRKHSDLIPEGYTAARAVYDFINGKNYGVCMICKKKVYTWNDKINRYNNLCDDPSCRAKVREIALERHIKVYNKPTLLNDPEQQEKMLSNRKISGTYEFQDGGKLGYTGTYEKKALEFMDQVLNIPSKDIQAPGPVFEYQYGGKKHLWITDIYYIPANLVIEIKDGGSNPNNRSMVSYREKQIAKETMITKLGTFNYLRLTNNDFVQLLDIFADMKMEALENENPKATIRINEEVGGLPPQRPPEAYIVPYGTNNVFDGFAYTDTGMDKMLLISDDEEGIIPMIESEFRAKYETGPALIYTGENSADIVNSIHEEILNCKADPMYFVEKFTGVKLTKWQQILLSESFKYYDEKREKQICHFIENAVALGPKDFDDSNIVNAVDNVFICNSDNGFYAVTPSDFYMASDYYTSMDELERNGVIDLMNDIYSRNSAKEGDDEDA